MSVSVAVATGRRNSWRRTSLGIMSSEYDASGRDAASGSSLTAATSTLAAWFSGQAACCVALCGLSLAGLASMLGQLFRCGPGHLQHCVDEEATFVKVFAIIRLGVGVIAFITGLSYGCRKVT
jgi:hypothetical protein